MKNNFLVSSVFFVFISVFAPAPTIAYAAAGCQPAMTESQKMDDLNELPQIFYKQNGEAVIKWIEGGIGLEISEKDTPDFSERITQLAQQYRIPLKEALGYGRARHRQPQTGDFEHVTRWLAVSDIHGQYELFVKLLQEHQVIDEDLNWIFGDSHLVINGDIMDRGQGVTEALWLVFKLQQQAAALGGRVHFNMGNHELMVLDNDLRYIHKKYAAAQDILGESYHDQFSQRSFFGQWLSEQSLLFRINGTGFVHAGISPEVVALGLQPAEINRLFVDSIMPQEKDIYRESELLRLLATTNGPVWYRGYFNDENLTADDIDAIFQWWGIDHMVVGHTSQDHVLTLFDGRIFAIDSSIKNGRSGEVLIYENGEFFRGLVDGSRVLMEEALKGKK